MAFGARRRAAQARCGAPSPHRRSGPCADRSARSLPSRGPRSDSSRGAPRPAPPSRRSTAVPPAGATTAAARAASASRSRDRARPRRPAAAPAPRPPSRAARVVAAVGRGCGAAASASAAASSRRDTSACARPRPRSRRSGRRPGRARSPPADRDRPRRRCPNAASTARRASGQSTAKIAAAVISANTNQSVMASFHRPESGIPVAAIAGNGAAAWMRYITAAAAAATGARNSRLRRHPALGIAAISAALTSSEA